jgi:fumarylacetoacetase
MPARCTTRTSIGDQVLDLHRALGHYTDLYIGFHHISAVGKSFWPDNPLLPIYKCQSR